MSLFDSLAPAAIIESIERLRAEADKAHYDRLQLLDDFYTGHYEASRYLLRHVGEGGDEYSERAGRYRHHAYARFVANKLRSALYGGQVERTLSEASEEQTKLLADVFAKAGIDAVQRLFSQGQVVHGDGYAFVMWKERLGRIAISNVHASRVTVEEDPDDPCDAVTFIEERIDTHSKDKNGKDLKQYWIWTREWYNCVDADGNDISFMASDGVTQLRGKQTNPYGIIPYIHWRGLPLSGYYYGLSAIDGIVDLNRAFNDQYSDYDIALLYQAKSIPVMRGSGGISAEVRVGARNALTFDDPAAELSFPTPSPAFDAMRVALKDLEETIFNLGGVPVSVIRGENESSGIALAIKYRTMQEIVGDLAVSARQAEAEMIEAICAIGNLHGLSLPKDPKPEVDLHENVLPNDTEAEFNRDLQLWQNDLMTTEDMVIRWRMKTPQNVEEYLAKLDAQRSSRQTAVVPPAESFNVGEPKAPQQGWTIL